MMIPCDICGKSGHVWFACPLRSTKPADWKPDRLTKSTQALSQMRCAELFTYEPTSGILAWRIAFGTAKAGSRAGTRKPSGYRMVRVDGRSYQEHRIIWIMERGALPSDGKEVDHKNRVRDDNRWENLREATRAEQQINSSTQKNNKHGRGVDYRADRKKWRATIYVGGKAVPLGSFDTQEQAQSAYRDGAVRYYGEFAPEQAPSVDTKLSSSPEDYTQSPLTIKSRGPGRPQTITDMKAYKADKERQRRARNKHG